MPQPLPKYCESMKKSYLTCLNGIKPCDDSAQYKKSVCLLKYIKQCDTNPE